jgi:hypothetical protein
MSRLTTAFVFLVALAAVPPAAFGDGFFRLPIGAGGFATGFTVAGDGTKLVRTDTYGAYLYSVEAANPGNAGGTGGWQQLVTTFSMPPVDAHFGLQNGVWEIAVAPSNTNHFYMVFNGYVYSSTNKGTSWNRTMFTRDTSADTSGNNPFRFFGRFMAVDPVNDDVVYVGTEQNLRVTMDGGANWITISSGTISAPIPSYNPGSGTYNGAYAIAFDRSSRVSGGKTQGIYISSYGNGVYHSTDGGAHWTLTSNGPTTPQHMICNVDGTLWLTNYGSSIANAWTYRGGSWTNLSVSSRDRWASVAVDPANPGHVYLIDSGGGLAFSPNNGISFTPNFRYTSQIATDIPWLANSPSNNNAFMDVGDAAFDPSVSNMLWMSSGEAVWTTEPPTSATSFTWASHSTAMEQLVANWILSPPGGTPIGLVSDKVAFLLDNDSAYPSVHGVTNAGVHQIVHSRAGDWASSSPSSITALAQVEDFNGDESAVSSDSGLTWTKWPSSPPGVPGTYPGGGLAASTPTNWVLIPSNNTAHVWYTKDEARSWYPAAIAGVPTAGETGWGFAYFLFRHIVCADRVVGDTFYAYNNGAAGDQSFAGIYWSDDSGEHWTKVHTGPMTNYANGNFNATLKCVLGQAGNLFYTDGPLGSPIFNTAGPLMYSINGGKSWTRVPNMLAVTFGFGVAAPGHGYPAIYVVGFYKGVYGIYRSIDQASTWTKLGDYPLGSFDLPQTIEGDAKTYGRVYMGFAGSGFIYGQFN